ncbi:MAG: hypothetical protein HUU21_25910 [Polyangiaceae bacterium]|nr:hypothetical protein [Polyangiaceae bacterium]
MAGLLTEFLAAGLINKLDGDDARFAKMERAAKAVAQELSEERSGLIRAILAGLDPDVPADDPAIVQAEQALLNEWKSMHSVHTSPPIGLFRAILLEACSQVAEDKNNAAILWLTAADTLPLLRLGKEEPVVRRLMEMLAARTEEAALVVPEIPSAPKGQATLEMEVTAAVKSPPPRKVNREELLLLVAATAGPNYRNNAKAKPLTNPNPHWPNDPTNWSWAFADRMHAVLADELDALASEATKQQTALVQQFVSSHTAWITALRNALTSQQRWVQDALKANEARQKAEQLRLSALWWSEALYSPSMRCSYRELSPPFAAVLMAIDLLDQVMKPTPASVSYLLAEAVHRLPGAEISREHGLRELLSALREARGRLPKGWLDALSPPPTKGRLSLRDLVILALMNDDLDLDVTIKRFGAAEKIAFSLPILSRALFRQEQAVRLAESTT